MEWTDKLDAINLSEQRGVQIRKFRMGIYKIMCPLCSLKTSNKTIHTQTGHYNLQFSLTKQNKTKNPQTRKAGLQYYVTSFSDSKDGWHY